VRELYLYPAVHAESERRSGHPLAGWYTAWSMGHQMFSSTDGHISSSGEKPAVCRWSTIAMAWASVFTIQKTDGSVSKVEMATPRALIYKVLFPSISTFETLPLPPCPLRDAPSQGTVWVVVRRSGTSTLTASQRCEPPAMVPPGSRACPVLCETPYNACTRDTIAQASRVFWDVLAKYVGIVRKTCREGRHATNVPLAAGICPQPDGETRHREQSSQ